MTSARERGQQQQGESLTSRITSINMMATGVAVLLACVILVGIESLFLRGSMLDDLRVQASIIGDNEAAPLVFGDGEAARKILHTLGASPAILEADLLAANGIPLATYRQPGWESGGNGGEEALSAFLLPPFVDIEQPIDLDGQQIGTLRLRASMRPLYRRLLVYAGSTLAIALGVMLGAFLLVSRMRRNVVHAEQRLRFLAHTDPVTRLPNRHVFNERLALAVQEAELSGESMALLMLDLDDFKLVNDSFGHPSGDVLLAEVARRLEKGLRHTDFVCRLGGTSSRCSWRIPRSPARRCTWRGRSWTSSRRRRSSWVARRFSRRPASGSAFSPRMRRMRTNSSAMRMPPSTQPRPGASARSSCSRPA